MTAARHRPNTVDRAMSSGLLEWDLRPKSFALTDGHFKGL
jgi:hypothetical protein